MQSSIPKPEKFSNDCDINIWLKQFELFTTLTDVPKEKLHNILLAYMDLHIFETIITSISEKEQTFENIKSFLLGRYSTTDKYMVSSTFDLLYIILKVTV